MTAEWEEGELGGRRSPTQASSLLLFLLVMVMVEPKGEERGRRGRGAPHTFSIPFDKEVIPV